ARNLFPPRAAFRRTGDQPLHAVHRRGGALLGADGPGADAVRRYAAGGNRTRPMGLPARSRTPLPLPSEVRVRPALGAVRHSVVSAGGNDRSLCESVSAPGERIQPLLLSVRGIPVGNDRHLAGGNDRNPVRGLGTGGSV